MIRGLLWHVWMLVTFRHDGRGLPNDHLGPWAVFVVTACSLAWMRWENPGSACFMLAYLFAVAWWTVPMSSGLAMLSIVFDVAAIAGADSDFVGAWELTGCAALGFRHSRIWR